MRESKPGFYSLLIIKTHLINSLKNIYLYGLHMGKLAVESSYI